MRSTVALFLGLTTRRLAITVGLLLGAGYVSAQAETAQMCLPLTVAHFADAVGLDPHIATAMTSQHVFEQSYSTLVKFDSELRLEPDLAESWELSADETEYTFHLRQDARWHNGRAFVANDVVYSIERIISLGGPWSARFDLLDEIVVEDDYTVRFVLSEPFTPFLSVLAEPKAAIVPREAVEQYGDLQNVVVGTGPFRMVEYRPGDYAHLVWNEDYWIQDQPHPSELVIRFMPDEATRIAALRTGEVDMIPLNDPLSVTLLGRNPNINIVSVPILRRNVLVLQTQQPPLDDLRVRQALLLAVDRQGIIDTALNGQGVPSGVFPPGLGDWALPLTDLPLYVRDVERARELLSEAGYENGLSVSMYVSPEYGVHIPIAQVLQQQWAEIGVSLDIQSVEWGVLLNNWGNGTFQILNMPYAGRSDPYYYTTERFHSTSPGNASRLVDLELDLLMERGIESADQDFRKPIYDELQRQIIELAPIIYLSTATEEFAMASTVEDYVGQPSGWRSFYWSTCKR